MIFIKILIKYAKLLGIFILIEILIAFIMGFANLVGVNNSLSSILIFIINLIIFFIYGYKSGKETNKKGFIEGLIIDLILICTLFILNLIFFHKGINFGTLIYYLALLFISIISATIGKNKKIDSTPDKK